MVTNKRAKVVDEAQPVAGPSKGRVTIKPTKKQQGGAENEEGSGSGSDDNDESGSDSGSEDSDDLGDDYEGIQSEEDDDDDDDIRQANEDAHTVNKKKRKRALPQPVFGSMLSSLISAPAPSRPLRPLHPPASEEALERRALKLLQANRHEREERGHVSDVIAGWTARPNVPFSQWNRIDESNATAVATTSEHAAGGADKERELRRLAQRGAVRLFNAIKAAQSTTAEQTAAPSTSTSTRTASIKGSAARAIKEASPAASVASMVSTKTSQDPLQSADKKKLNLLGGRGKQEALANLSRASFLELFKSGGGAAKPKLAI